MASQLPPVAGRHPSPDIKQQTLAIAARTILAEADALTRTAAELSDEFFKAIMILFDATGRIVVTGMGKSGHIARKIAATFSSTGTPSIFIHPGEASHGDLGMIIPGDVIIAISNSGETAELKDILFYARRNKIPVIAMTRSRNSSLGQAAETILILPPEEEACPLGVAPMVSTTVSLALGDALAAALMLQRGFGIEDFRNFHPGGKLGATLLTVVEIMHHGDELPVIHNGVAMRDAIMTMTEKGFGCVGILDEWRNLIGVLTDGDLRRAMPRISLSDPVDRYMSRKPQQISATSLIADAAALMEEKGIPSVFITNTRGAPIGIIHLRDLLRAKVI
jgi:arabinose-5-phosphate isomerase